MGDITASKAYLETHVEAAEYPYAGTQGIKWVIYARSVGQVEAGCTRIVTAPVTNARLS